jgi:peptide/nickel transport system ATP-binding protein
MSEAPLLRVEDLEVAFPTESGLIVAATGVSFSVRSGETLAVVGESGSGKSVTALAMMRLHAKSTRITGKVIFDGTDLLSLSEDEMRSYRGSSVAMIFQDPMTALNPVFTVGSQIVEAIRLHQPVKKDAAKRKAIELLELVGVPEPKRRAMQYPHEFSGGMRQRAMIAMAISNGPRLLIADEPTTALDVTVQAQVMEVIADVQRATGAALLLITHDLGLVAGTADRVHVMYAGRIMESGSLDDIFYGSANPYTRALIASIPAATARSHSRLESISGSPPSLLNPPSGCAFHPRCAHATALCSAQLPPVIDIGPEHRSRCHYATDVAAVRSSL